MESGRKNYNSNTDNGSANDDESQNNKEEGNARLRVVSNFGDGDCGVGEIQTRGFGAPHVASPPNFMHTCVYLARPTVAKIRDYSRSRVMLILIMITIINILSVAKQEVAEAFISIQITLSYLTSSVEIQCKQQIFFSIYLNLFLHRKCS